VPTQIANLVKSAANTAIIDMTQHGSDGDYSLFSHSDNNCIGSYWFLTGSYNKENDRGAYVSAWIPKSIDWLTCESEDYSPSLELYYNYGGNRRRTNENGQLVSDAIENLPNPYIRVNRNEYGCFVCVRRALTDAINLTDLQDPKKLENDLKEIFTQFRLAMHPGMERARGLMGQRQRA
jgi:hypothetical protein